MTDEIPQWAWVEVEKRAPTPSRDTAMEWVAYTDKLCVLAASLIAKHEEQPVDPLLIEAREIAGKFFEEYDDPIASGNFRAGKLDSTHTARVALEGLRRGIELGKAGAA